MSRERLRSWPLLLVLNVIWLGCESPSVKPAGSGDSQGTKAPNTSLVGEIKIEGSSTVGPISTKAREEFNKAFPKVNVSVGEQGTSNGFSSFSKKEIDIADASRPIKASELKKCQDAGMNFYEIPIAYDGLTFVVNKDNDFCKELTVEQLQKIFRQDLAAKTWQEINPEWPDQPIAIYAPGIQSGTHDYCVEVLGKEDGQALRSDSQATLSENDKVLVTGVTGDKYAIGFFGFSYYESSKDQLTAVAIVNSQGEAVVPSLETIENGTYEPFSRPLFIYVDQNSYDRAEVSAFVDFYLENVIRIVKDASYVPLPQEVYDLAIKALEEQTVGTHFLNADGTSREGGLAELYSGSATK